MKPSFALNLTESSVALLHRTARGWMPVGEAAFDNPNLPAALRYLRRSALGLSPRGIQTKLVIPNSQIRYLDIAAPGPDAASRRAQIAIALDGRTPYAVDDLVFDWRGTGPVVQVAVVARETLTEAEDFANSHRFNAVSFVAIPDAGSFSGEPWFGLTKRADKFLPEGEKVDRDQDPIVILARDMTKAEPDAAAAVEEEAETASEAGLSAALEPEQGSASEPGTETDLGSGTDGEHPLSPMPEPQRQGDPAPLAAAADAPPLETPDEAATPLAAPTPNAVGAPDAVEKHDEVVEPAPAPEVAPEAAAAPEVVAEPVATTISTPQPEPFAAIAPEAALDPIEQVTTRAQPSPVPEAPMIADVPVPAEPARMARVTAPTAFPDAAAIEDDLPPAPSASALMAFASRRNTEPGDSKPPTAASRMPMPAAAKIPSPVAERLAARMQPNGAEPPVVARPKQAKAPPPLRSSLPPERPATDRQAVAVTSPPARPEAAKPAFMVTAETIPGARKRKPQIAAASGSGLPADQAKSLTKPGGTFGTGPNRGKPRYLGLILTALLLVFLGLVAAWSTYVITARDATDAADPVAVADVASLPEGTVPAIEDEIAADQQDPADLAADVAADAVIPPPPLQIDTATEAPVQVAAAEAAQPTPAAPAPLPSPLPAPDAVADAEAAAVPAGQADQAGAQDIVEPAPGTVVGNEVAAAAPPDDFQDEIFLTSQDAPPSVLDPTLLPPPTALADALPGAQLAPPPFGTVYQFDANGLIRPTSDGVVTPEGVRLVAGPPPRVPPRRPAAAVAAVPPAPPTASLAAEAEPAAVATPFPADPALANARPRVRPAGLVPAPRQAEDDAALSIAPGTRLSSLRPQPRPQTVLAASEQARLASEGASIAAQAAVEAVVTEANLATANNAPFALAVSRKPAARPKNLTPPIRVAAAAATLRAPEPEPQQQDQAPEAEDEPELVASAAPRIPTRASVAKQATFVNAINLSKLNLIGVYGTQSNRYALVRQPNGRYKKVRPGDSIDGGRIAAITSSEVRYQKGGRILSLKMPKG